MNAKYWKPTALALVLATTLAAAGCGDDQGPPGSDGVKSGARVTAPVPAANFETSADIIGLHINPTTSYSYVFARTKEGEEVVSMSVSNLDRGATAYVGPGEESTRALMIEAAVGDRLDVTVEFASGLSQTTTIPVPPETPPIVVRTNPPSKKFGVPLNVIPMMMFNEPVVLPSGTSGSETVQLLRNGVAIPGILRVSNDGIFIEFVPEQWLEPNTDYELVVGTGVTDLSGLPLEAPETIEFQTGNSSDLTPSVFPESVSLQVGQYFRFYVGLGGNLPDSTQTLSPVNSAWRSTDQSVVTVDADGYAQAVGPGSAFVIYEDISGSDSSAVTVSEGVSGSFSLIPETLIMLVGDTAVVTPVWNDSLLTLVLRALDWRSTDQSVATVRTDGVVTAVGLGEAWIVAETPNSDNLPPDSSFSDSVLVRVVEPSPVLGMVIVPDSMLLAVGDTGTFTVQPADTSILIFRALEPTWSSTNTAVATIDARGVVSAVAPGEALIIAVEGNLKDTALVQVSATLSPEPVFRVTPDSVILDIGATSQLATNGATGPVTWRSNDESIATIDATGLLQAVSFGMTTVTAVSGNQTAQALIVVIDADPPPPPPATGFTVTPDSAILNVAETLQLGTTNAPGAVAWQSSDQSIATVDATGLLNAIAAGTATVTATSEGQSATALILVVDQTPPPPPPPTSGADFVITPDSILLTVGATGALQVQPADPSILIFRALEPTWTTTDPSVATISPEGVVTGISVGQALIVATEQGMADSALVQVIGDP